MTPTQIPVPDQGSPSTALLTDKYELTMLQGALRAGTAQRRCVFELFGRKLPASRRYGVVASFIKSSVHPLPSQQAGPLAILEYGAIFI